MSWAPWSAFFVGACFALLISLIDISSEQMLSTTCSSASRWIASLGHRLMIFAGDFKKAYPSAKLIAPKDAITRHGDKDLKFDGGRCAGGSSGRLIKGLMAQFGVKTLKTPSMVLKMMYVFHCFLRGFTEAGVKQIKAWLVASFF